MLNIYKNNITLLLSLSLVTILPPIIKEVTLGSSYALGIFLSSVIVIMLVSFHKKKILIDIRDLNLTIILTLFILIHFLVTWQQSIYLNLEFDYHLSRWAGSVIGIYLMLFSSQILANYINSDVDECNFNLIIMIITTSFLIFATLASFGINPIFTDIARHDKPMFIYGEPSHFFLTFGAFMMFFIIKSNYKNVFMIYMVLLLGKIKSAVYAVQLLLYAFISYKKYFYLLLIPFALLISIDLNYYISRLDLFSENRSLSADAFLSGILRAYTSFYETNFIGFGFNQFGFSNLDSLTSNYVYGLAQNSNEVANRFDGTILSAKLVGEFGIFGIIMIFAYLLYFFRFMVFIINSSKEFINLNPILFFMLSVYITFIIDLFIRSPGYFTSHFYLFILACTYLYKNIHKLKKYG